MTVNEMLADLRTKGEDPNDELFTALVKVEMLNDAQDRVFTMINREALLELTKIQTPCSGNPYALSSLSSDYYGSGYSVSMVKLIETDLFMNAITFKDIKMLEMDSLAPDENNPYYYVWDTAINSYIGDATASTTVYYLSKPTVLVAGTQVPDLSPKLHQIIVTIATGLLWSSANKLDRADTAFETAYAQIDAINERGL